MAQQALLGMLTAFAAWGRESLPVPPLEVRGGVTFPMRDLSSSDIIGSLFGILEGGCTSTHCLIGTGVKRGGLQKPLI